MHGGRNGRLSASFGWLWRDFWQRRWVGGGAQAQTLIIDIFPSQDNPTQTLWIFSGNGSRPFYGSTIRSGGNNFHQRDSWKTELFYIENYPNNAIFNLTPLFGSTNAIDIDSITKRLPGAPGFGPFSANTVQFDSNNVTNSPTMNAGSATKTIGSIFMNSATQDETGIRGTAGGNLAYTTNNVFRWFGSGIIDKPIGDFRRAVRPGGLEVTRTLYSENNVSIRPYFLSGGSITIRRHPYIIPEPAEYALVFGLFALGFVIFMKYKVQQDGKRK